MYGLSRSPILAHFQKTPVKALGSILANIYCQMYLHLPILVAVHDSWKELVDVGAGADEEQEAEERGREVEQGRLGQS